MLVSEAIQRVQSLYSAGVQSNDSRLTERHTYSALLTARSILLRQRINKNQKVSQWTYQTLPCVELVTAPIHECACVPANDCIILKSKHKIPEPITGLEESLIQYVTSIDGSISFDKTSFENNRYNAGNKFTSKNPNYYIKNGFLYVTILKSLKAITISGLFYDFFEAKMFPSICESDCEECNCPDIMELDFPIDADLVKPLLEIANQELIIIMKQVKQDNTNNAQDDTSVGTMIHQPNQPEGE